MPERRPGVSRLRAAAVIALAALAGACGTDGGGRVAVVESRAPLWGPGQGWTVDTVPTLDIPGADTARGFGSITALARLADGRVVLAESSPAFLRYFAADGRPLYQVGRPGQDVVTFESVLMLAPLPGDSLLVFDVGRQRALLFDPNGAPSAAFLLPRDSTTGNGVLPRGVDAAGRLVLQRDETRVPFPGAVGEVAVDSTRLLFVDRQGKVADSSVRLPAGEIFGFSVATLDSAPVVAPLARPFGGMLRVAATPGGLWVGMGDRWELTRLDREGRPAAVVRLDRPREPLTPEVRDTFVARYRARRASDDPRSLMGQFARGVDQAPFPDSLPAYLSILVAADSTLWLQHGGLFEGEPGDGSLNWTVLDPAGRWLGDVTLPARFRPASVGRDGVFGIAREPSGRVHVRVYPIRRP